MSDALLTGASAGRAQRAETAASGVLAGKRGRQVREALLAYLFLAPALIIIFLFGLFPLAFSAYESTLTGLSRILGNYDGLGNYVKAMDSLAYVIAFWLALALLALAGRLVGLMIAQARLHRDRPWLVVAPAVASAVTLALLTRFVFILLPELLAISDKMRGLENRAEAFRVFLIQAFLTPAVLAALVNTILALLAAGLLSAIVLRFARFGPRASGYFGRSLQAALLTIGGGALAWLTWLEVQKAFAAALEAGQPLALWSQIVTVSAGLLLLLLGWLVWRGASGRESNVGMAARLMAGAALLVGAWVLIGELPPAVAAGDDEWWRGLRATTYYALGTIPVELIVALVLASLLFRGIHGKAIFRMVYFLPYIAPFVGTAAAFRILFSGRASAPINAALGLVGIDPLTWLNEPAGIFQLIAGPNVVLPEWAVGPSLALVVIMIYGSWTFFGFNTVVFLAGLGSIPGELYEAAAMDGANRWAQFRHVTLPLLSPTIYFLTLWAIIGTFKAFNHIYVMRTAAALGTTDTASIVIFEAFKRDTRYGYASALAILLLLIILLLTAVNNRFASRRVFYG
ncbi:MAG: ABC transporter permease subunit [Candidatus Promineifilaceae bacterium]